MHPGEKSFQVMTHSAEGVGGQTLVCLSTLYEYPHSFYLAEASLQKKMLAFESGLILNTKDHPPPLVH